MGIIKGWLDFEQLLMDLTKYKFEPTSINDFSFLFLLIPKFHDPCCIVIEKIQHNCNLIVYIINANYKTFRNINSRQNIIELTTENEMELLELINNLKLLKFNNSFQIDNNFIIRIDYYKDQVKQTIHTIEPDKLSQENIYNFFERTVQIIISTMKDKVIYQYFRAIKYNFKPAINLRR